MEFELVDKTQETELTDLNTQTPKESPRELILYESAQILELKREIEFLKGKIDKVFWANMVFRSINLVINPLEIMRSHAKDAMFSTVVKLFQYL